MGITKKTRDKIICLYKNGYSCDEISKTLAIPESIIRHICLNKEKDQD